MIRRTLTKCLRWLIARVFRKEIVFLPVGSRTNGAQLVLDLTEGRSLLPVRYPYRADADHCVSYEMYAQGRDLNYRLFAATYTEDLKPKPGPLVLSCQIPAVEKGDRLRVHLLESRVCLNDQPREILRGERPSARKYLAELELSTPQGRLHRRCSHYLPREQKTIGQEYYFGDDYVDYPRQLEVWVEDRVNRIRQHCPG